MRLFWTLAALAVAFLFHTALSRIAPAEARIVDPFLLVLVYCGLVGGETHGMLAGAAGGWLLDVYFGGNVHGLAPLSKLLVGFAVGLGSTRFLLAAPTARLIVLFAAAVVDALLFGQLAGAFDVPVTSLSFGAVLARGVVNAALGLLVFHLLDRHWPGEGR